MTASPSIDLSGWLHEQLSEASPDLLRQMISTFVEALMSAEADAVCGAAYGARSTERVNSRNGYRAREWDTRAGTVEVAIPKLRTGSYFPEWLLERRRRAEAALVSVVATSYLLGVSTRRMEKLVETLGITRLSKSQVSEMAKDLDAQVAAFRTRPLDAGPYTFVAADALVLKVREDGRTVGVHALVATGVNAAGYREILGLHVWRYRTGSPWRDLPQEFGPWQTAWKRHARFAADGVWDQVLTVLLTDADAAGELDWAVSVDSTIARAHQHGTNTTREVVTHADRRAGGSPELHESADRAR